jgi:hypothetical protein
MQGTTHLRPLIGLGVLALVLCTTPLRDAAALPTGVLGPVVRRYRCTQCHWPSIRWDPCRWRVGCTGRADSWGISV